MRKTRHILEYLFFRAAARILGLFPLRIAGRFGGWLGEKVLTVFRFRRTTIHDNLRHAFPGASDEEIREIARQSFRSVGTSLVELLCFPTLSRDRLKSLARFDDHELFKNALDRGKGVIMLTAHFGNWELAPQVLCVSLEIPFLILYKVQSNRLIDAEIARRRTMYGNDIVPMGISVREILKSLREGRCVAIAADQSAPKESIRMPFFGRDVPVFQGAASFALKTGAALITVFVIRNADGSYTVKCSEIPANDLTDSEEGVRELTRRHLKETESVIRDHPGQWMWMHRRWKHSEQGTSHS